MILNKVFLIKSLALCLIFLSSCTYTGGIENPLVRKLSWFSFLNGDDIRRLCPEHGTDRLRLIYNGIYHEQVRIYDISFLSRKMTGRVLTAPYVSEISAENFDEIFEGKTFELSLNDKELRIFNALAQINVQSQKMRPGTRLSSNDFYWTIQYCSQGKFHFNMIELTPLNYQDFDLVNFTLSLDLYGINYNIPRELTRSDIIDFEEFYPLFYVELGENRLVGSN